MPKKGLYSGSFDPITTGHLDIIKRAAVICDELVVGVVCNVNKEPLFSLEERVNMVKSAVAGIPNVKVDSFTGLLAEYVNSNGFDIVIRGLRAATDFEYEIQMAQVNAGLFNGYTETVFLMTDPRYSYISSSAVRELMAFNADVSRFVPEAVAEQIKKKNQGR